MTPGVVTGCHHGGITVTSLEASLRFYCDTLGLEVASRRHITESYVLEFTGAPATGLFSVFLAIPGTDTQIELLEYEGADRHPAASPPSDPANVHVCLLVDDLEAVHARLVAAGYRGQSPAPVPIPVGPNAGGKLLYAVDPDGAYVELLELPPGR